MFSQDWPPLIKIFSKVKELKTLKSDKDFKKEKYFCPIIAIHYCVYHIENGVYIQINADCDSATDIYLHQAKAIFLSGR